MPGYRTPKEIFETKSPSTGGVDASAKTIMAQEEPERRCFCDTGLILYSWYNPDTRVMATNKMMGDSLNLIPFLSKPLGPPTKAVARDRCDWLCAKGRYLCRCFLHKRRGCSQASI